MGAIAGCAGVTEPTEFRISFIEIINWSGNDQTVSLEIQKDGEQAFADQREIPQEDDDGLNSWRIDEGWLDERAAYTVELDGEGFDRTTTSTESVRDSYDLDPETTCLSWTFQIREDGSVGVFPSPGCPRETDA